MVQFQNFTKKRIAKAQTNSKILEKQY